MRDLFRKLKVLLDHPKIEHRIFYDPKTLVVIGQKSTKNNKNHSFNDEPALTIFHPKTGNKIIDIYCFEGLRHRTNNKPAVIFYDPVTTGVIKERYFLFGAFLYESIPAPTARINSKSKHALSPHL